MAQQTAVEWLNENNIIICESFLYDKIRQSFVDQLINCFKINLEQAKEMEKKQIMDAYDNVALDDNGNFMTGEQYYNDTYTQSGTE